MSELRFETLRMRGADVGPENPLPPLARGRDRSVDPAGYAGFEAEMLEQMAYGHPDSYLPYTMQDRYTRRLEERDYRAAVLENDTLRATFVLDLGGRLWSLVHKPTGRELLEANPIFQPANLAIRNAWFSGGVEWNIGMVGHFPLTCSPLFAGRVTTADGTPALRMWEWERLRRTPYQVDAWLPAGSPVLYVRVRIINPNDDDVPMYWWSNAAVPETADTRVLVPADSAYNFGYGEGGPARVDIPVVQGTDITYTTRIQRACDFFFHLDTDVEAGAGQRPWISALDGDGCGYVQVSTQRLRGRKLFLWGMGAGGRRWQEWLSEPGHAYLEIQSGLARTQMQHVPMPARADWQWLEGYGYLEADAARVHGDDWGQARAAVEDSLEALVPRTTMEADLDQAQAWVDETPAVEQRGSGWARLEARRRRAAGESAADLDGRPFDDASLGELQAPWLALLQDGALPDVDPEVEPTSYMAQPEWRLLLEEAVAAGRGDHWYSWYQLGVLRYAGGDYEGAGDAWTTSLKRRDTAWARRNLAVLAREEGHLADAAAEYEEAVRLRPDLLPLVYECGQCFLEAEEAGPWLKLFDSLPAETRQAGRIRLLEGRAGLAVRDYERVGALLQEQLVIDDLREGERSLSTLWVEYHEQRLADAAGTDVDDAIRERVKSEHPVPAHLDFRMHVEG
jgi:hypothetical protein